jgi:hypothetical protein
MAARRGSGEDRVQPKPVGQQPERAVALQVLAAAGHHLEPAGAGGLQRLGKQTGLADPGLALDDHDGRPAPRRPVQGVDERP